MDTARVVNPPTDATVGWVLYDDTCGVCSRWVPFWAGTLRKRGIGIAPLQADWVRQRLHAPPEELLQDLRLLMVDGSEKRGADAYREVMRRIWWAWPFYLFAITPILRNIFDWGYRTFARNRYRVSNACRLKPRDKKD